MSSTYGGLSSPVWPYWDGTADIKVGWSTGYGYEIGNANSNPYYGFTPVSPGAHSFTYDTRNGDWNRVVLHTDISLVPNWPGESGTITALVDPTVTVSPTWLAANPGHSVSIAYSTVPAAVPEPATWLTLLVGFGLMGAALRRRPGLPAAQAL